MQDILLVPPKSTANGIAIASHIRLHGFVEIAEPIIDEQPEIFHINSPETRRTLDMNLASDYMNQLLILKKVGVHEDLRIQRKKKGSRNGCHLCIYLTNILAPAIYHHARFTNKPVYLIKNTSRNIRRKMLSAMVGQATLLGGTHEPMTVAKSTQDA
jgi:hypothetical protein